MLRTVLLLATLAASASFATSLQQLLAPATRLPSAATPSRPAVAAVRLMAEDGAAEDAAADEVVPEDAAAEGAPKEAAAKEEEEDEDDLLSSPAFLKQKLKVLEKELEEVAAKKAEAEAEAAVVSEEWVDKRTRLQGDFDNFKARHVNQTLEAQVEARIKLLQDFLPVLDNFDRARQSIKPEGETQDAVNAKYQEMHANLMTILTDELGMEKIEAVGAEFDYNLHMAIQQVPSAEYDEGIVCAEMQPGYVVKDQLVRAAYVMVSSGM